MVEVLVEGEKMARSRYELMSEDELKELAKERNKRTGCFKKTALSAQTELYRRTHWEVADPFVADEEVVDRAIEDIQYNGRSGVVRPFPLAWVP